MGTVSDSAAEPQRRLDTLDWVILSSRQSFEGVRMSVIISAKNEYWNLPHLLGPSPSLVDEIILVDDRSKDGRQVARKILPEIVNVEQDRPGESAALCWGSRLIQARGTLDMVWSCKLENRLSVWPLHLRFGCRFSDLCYGYAAMWRDNLKRMDLDQSDGFEIETSMNIQALTAGLKLTEVARNEYRRIYGHSHLRTSPDGWRILRTIMLIPFPCRLRVPSASKPKREPSTLTSALSLDLPSRVPAAFPDITSASAVICTHLASRYEDLRKAVASLRAQTRAPSQVIVVVDRNPSLEAKISKELPDVLCLPNERSPGLSGARNSGLARAEADLVAFLDDDALAEPNWIRELCRPYADPHVLGVGGPVLPIWPQERRPDWLPEEFDWVVGCTYKGHVQGLAAVRNLIGCNMSFRRAAFDFVGGFSERLGREGTNGAGGEETEFCIRVQNAFPSSRILFQPTAQVRHRVHADRVSWRYFARRCLAEGRSKAAMVQLTGTSFGLTSERSHALNVLPKAAIADLGVAVTDGNLGALKCAGSILGGLGLTCYGYLEGRLTRRGPGRGNAAPFAPYRIVDVDLDRPSGDLSGADPVSGLRCGNAFCLVRRSEQPVSIVELPIYGADISTTRLRSLLSGEEDQVPPPARVHQVHELPRTQVIIATRDRPEALEKCLGSVLAVEHPNFEILVVDNAPSGPSTRQLIEERFRADQRVRYLREDQPGLGRAHNRGLLEVDAPVVAITDDDVIVDRRWLRALSARFAEGPSLGCVTGLILPLEIVTRAQYWTERHGGFGKGLTSRVFDLDQNRPTDPLFPYAAGSFGSGANMAFLTTALRSIGGFDDALGAGTVAKGGDDLAAFAAIIKAGFQLRYEPEAIVWHAHRRDRDAISRQAFAYGVGLGAYLTKSILDDPAAALAFVKAAPSGLAHVLSRSSSKNARLPSGYPANLWWRERWGMLVGAPLYVISRWSSRRVS